MGIVQIRKQNDDSTEQTNMAQNDNPDWIKFAAGGALITGGLLLLTGQRRAGAVVGAAGAGLALVDQKENVRTVWNQVPGYIDRLQTLINQVEEKVEAFSSKRDSLHQVLTSFRRGA
jgi:hypothetical protein